MTKTYPDTILDSTRAESFTRTQSWTTGDDMGYYEEDYYDGDSYPYPSEHQTSLIKGELADRIRAALKEPASRRVYITETRSYGGTEATQEHFDDISIRCGHHVVEFDDDSRKYDQYSPFAQMLAWLDDKAPKKG